MSRWSLGSALCALATGSLPLVFALGGHADEKTPAKADGPSTTPSAAVIASTSSPSALPVTTPLTLAQAIARADQSAATIKMARDRLVHTHAQLDEVKWIPWSQFSVSGGVAAVPELKGTAVYSPNGDISLSSKLGPAWRVSIDGAIPIYTFGKISSSTAAAEAAVKVAEADIEKMRILVHHDVRRAWFGLLAAQDGRYLLKQAYDKLAEAVKRAEENPDSEEADLLQMKVYQAEIGARFGEVEKYERIAKASLRFLMGLPEKAPLEVPDEAIAPPKKPLSDVLVYLASAKLHRPEVKMVRAGIEARTHLVDFAKARMYPDIALGLSFGYSNAPYIADQTNPFIVDNANYLRYGFGVVFKWNLDLLPGSARVRMAEAQLSEMRDTEALALGGVGLEVETAHATAKDASTREKLYAEAEQLAKRWVSSVSAAIALGTKDDKELILPLRNFVQHRYNHVQAIMDLDVAYSQLAVATGNELFATYD